MTPVPDALLAAIAAAPEVRDDAVRRGRAAVARGAADDAALAAAILDAGAALRDRLEAVIDLTGPDGLYIDLASHGSVVASRGQSQAKRPT